MPVRIRTTASQLRVTSRRREIHATTSFRICTSRAISDAASPAAFGRARRRAAAIISSRATRIFKNVLDDSGKIVEPRRAYGCAGIGEYARVALFLTRQRLAEHDRDACDQRLATCSGRPAWSRTRRRRACNRRRSRRNAGRAPDSRRSPRLASDAVRSRAFRPATTTAASGDSHPVERAHHSLERSDSQTAAHQQRDVPVARQIEPFAQGVERLARRNELWPHRNSADGDRVRARRRAPAARRASRRSRRRSRRCCDESKNRAPRNPLRLRRPAARRQSAACIRPSLRTETRACRRPRRAALVR